MGEDCGPSKKKKKKKKKKILFLSHPHIKMSVTLPMTFLFYLRFYYCVTPPIHLALEGDTVS
jgi:hypothetical protein